METEETHIKKRKRTRFTPSVISNIALIVGVLAIIAFVLYMPKTDFFKGAVLLRPTIEKGEETNRPGAILIDYITKNGEVGTEVANLTSLILESKYEGVKVNSFLFEFDGDLKKGDISEVKLLINGHVSKNSDYIWISPNRLLVDTSNDEILVKDRLPIVLQGRVQNSVAEKDITVFVSDISAVGNNSGKEIVNIGTKGKTDTVGTVLHIQK